MMNILRRTLFFFLLLAASPLAAQNWGIGVGTGPFVFGDFVERRLLIGTEGPAEANSAILSAATRAGLSADIESRFADRWAIRLEGAFTRAPLEVRTDGEGDGVELDAGEMDVATFSLPIVFRINPRGNFRFHILGGPAYAIYKIEDPPRTTGLGVFDDTRGRAGLMFGGGVAWMFSDRFGIEGQITDIATESPFRREDLPASATGVKIEKMHNVHTTVGIRWVF